MSDLDVSERVREVVEPLLVGQGLEVVDVEHLGGTIRVSIDRPGGIDLDAISDATRVVSDALDRADPVPSRYMLEVSSPGLERPLRTPSHYQRFVGATVTVRTHPEVEGERRVDGVLEAADELGIVVAGRALRYDEIERARTRFEWGPSPKPGKTAKTRTAKS